MFLIDSSYYSPLQGLILAIKDPKVAIFAIMTLSELLGLSFLQFFPTSEYVLLSYNCSVLADWFRFVGLPRPWDSARPLLCSSPRMQCSSGRSWGVINFSSYSPPWIIAAMVCCLNALHAGSQFCITFLDVYIDYYCLVDKTGERFFHIASWWWSVILGFIIALSTMSTAGRYVSLFFMASGYIGKALIPRVGGFTEYLHKRCFYDASLGLEFHFAASSVRHPFLNM
jgi:hypothetical protein